jgi:DNA-directed RNA polymerase III subunit RPC3
MSVQFGKLCSLILLEHFGEIVEKVGSDLFKCQGKPLQSIARSTQLPLQKVTNPNTALSILVSSSVARRYLYIFLFTESWRKL